MQKRTIKVLHKAMTDEGHDVEMEYTLTPVYVIMRTGMTHVPSGEKEPMNAFVGNIDTVGEAIRLVTDFESREYKVLDENGDLIGGVDDYE